MTLTGLEKSIILTVSYSNVFEFPLTKLEILKRLVTTKRVSSHEIDRPLQNLLDKKILKKDGDHYYISGQIIANINQRKKYSIRKKEEAKLFYNKAKYIPFIKAIALTGSLCVNNAKENDDTDWLIICQDYTLWIVRPFVILLAQIYGKRRERDGHHRDNSWCFNMFLTESSLAVTKSKRSIFSAYEVCQAEFVVDKNQVEKSFLLKNKWVEKYLANYFSYKLEQASKKIPKVAQNNFTNIVIKIINNMLFLIQFNYMKTRITREVVALDKALFHPRNTKDAIISNWKRVLQDVK